MPQITTRPEPPRGEYDFQDLCVLLLRKEWKTSNLQTFGRRGQSQNGVDILDFSGHQHPKGAQCKNYDPLQAISAADIRAAVNKAKQFSPSLSELWIMATAKKSAEAQLEVLEINQQHTQRGLFMVVLKTWDEILLMLDEHPIVADCWFSGGLAASLQLIDNKVTRIDEILHSFVSPISANTDDTCNKVLVRWDPKFRKTAASNDGLSFTYTQDYSIVLLTVEELIAAGATELAVDLNPSEVEKIKRQAPVALGNRIVSINSPETNMASVVGSILGPTFEEFSTEADWMMGSSDGKTAFVKGDLGTLANELFHFLLAMKNRLEADINLPDLLWRVQHVRARSKNPLGRINLAVIEGILSSYRPIKLDAVRLGSVATHRALELFSEFLKDHRYQSLSHQAHALGYKSLLKNAEKEFSRLAEDLVESPGHKGDLLLGELSLSTAAAPLPAGREFDTIVQSDLYLPPILSFAVAREKASRTYDSSSFPPIWPDDQ